MMADSSPATDFTRYFTLDEAVAFLPDVRWMLDEARGETNAARDEIVLFKRVLMAKKQAGTNPTEEEITLLRAKYDRFEEIYARWMETFLEKGVILRDLDTGLLDFPYHSRTNHEDYFLCWRSGEEGIFYFHPVTEGFSGRRPITLLPE